MCRVSRRELLLGGAALLGAAATESKAAPKTSPAKPGAVVVPGSRAIGVGPAKDWGLSVYAPIIIEYRDEKTEASVKLEDFLR